MVTKRVGKTEPKRSIRRFLGKSKQSTNSDKQVEHFENSQLLAIVNTVSSAMFSINHKGSIRVYNSALLSLLDTNQSVSGKYVDDVLALSTTDHAPVSLFELLKTSSGKLERDDLVMVFDEDDEIRLHVSAYRMESAYGSSTHGIEGYICTIRDITKEKSLEEERDEFISVVSHELRTPVTIAEGTVSNLQLYLERGAEPKKLIPAVQTAHEQLLLLASMINDLGTLSRAERGVGSDTEVIEVTPLIKELFSKYHTTAKNKGLALNIDVVGKLGKVNTSRLYLEEMLQNFITNAIKYTPKGSITIRAKKVDGMVEFSISDTGIGMTKTDTKHIFEKFYRSEDYRTRETSGTGLGLYVVHKLARKLHTKINVSSQLNHGSTFSFSLPSWDE